MRRPPLLQGLMLGAALLAGTVLLAATGQAAGVKIIAHPDLPLSEISPSELRSVFLMTTSRVAGKSVRPVLDSGALKEFSGEHLGKSFQAVEIYYRSLVFAGRGSMPTRFSSAEEVVSYVARTPGAIGYVRDDTPVVGVRTLRVR